MTTPMTDVVAMAKANIVAGKYNSLPILRQAVDSMLRSIAILDDSTHRLPYQQPGLIEQGPDDKAPLVKGLKGITRARVDESRLQECLTGEYPTWVRSAPE